MRSLWGILFIAHRGILFYCPLLLLTPLGLWQLVEKRGWRDAGPILAAVMAYAIFASGFVDWPAGWCAAARHVLPIVPIATITAFFASRNLLERRWGAAIVVVLISISAANALLTIALTPFYPPEFGAPLAQLVLPSLADGAGFSNLLSSWLGIAPPAVAILTGVTVFALVLWSVGRLVRGGRLRLAAISLTTIVVLLLSYSWQGSAPTAETEVMRSQVLRRLGHDEVADRIDESLLSSESSESN